MSRDPRYDVLFESVQIGPKNARNRFYQVPHCTGMGRQYPTQAAVTRGTKAEGGWGVVCTEQCDIHPTGNISSQVRLWDEQDIPYLARMTDRVHAHGSLAGVELAHNGFVFPNFESRELPIAPSARPAGHEGNEPFVARAMDKEDIRAFRRWHRRAALNARRAGFDIIYVYGAHDLSLLEHFLSRHHNHRTDEYGGSLKNRSRLLREVFEETKEAVGDSCAVAFRFAVDENVGADGITSDDEGREIVEMFANVPDLWDVNVSPWENDSVTLRFDSEGHQEPFISFVKRLTSKPVVGVGLYTSPDHMVDLVRKGILDFIGAARPSIADPFLPKKIEEGRLDDIRECIGCNICIASQGLDFSSPQRCTQNPTMGDEWRRGWHPERIPAKDTDDTVLVVGAGPAGLEAARALGQRGYQVTLAEATRELGGRVARECKLPGLASWGRVRDWRLTQIAKLTSVTVYRESRLDVQSVLEAKCSLVAIATGAFWRNDGVGRHRDFPLTGLDNMRVYTPDDIMNGVVPESPVAIYDDDHYYMGGVIAEKLRRAGLEVTLVTPSALVSSFTHYTLEQERIERRLLELGVRIVAKRDVVALHKNELEIACVYTNRRERLEAASAVFVTMQTSNGALYHDLAARKSEFERAGIRKVVRIGDALAPGIIAAAVYSGHRFARQLDVMPADQVDFRRENVELGEL